MHSAVASDLIETVTASGRLSSKALTSVLAWLRDPSLAEFVPEIQALVEQQRWSDLEDAFYQSIPIGTGGIRGPIGPGPNRINTRTIGKAAQALSEFIQARGEDTIKGGVVVGHEAR